MSVNVVWENLVVNVRIIGEKAVITFETPSKIIKAAEFICEKLDLSLDKYLSDCVLCGVNADLGDECVFQSSPLSSSLVDRVSEFLD